MKKILFGILVLGIVFSLCVGCTKEDPAQSIDYTELLAMMTQEIGDDISDYIGNVSSWCTYGGQIWALGTTAHTDDADPVTYENIRQLVGIDPSSGKITHSDLLLPEPLDSIQKKIKEFDYNNEDYSVIQWVSGGYYDTQGHYNLFLTELLTCDDQTQNVSTISLATIGKENRINRGEEIELPNALFDKGVSLDTTRAGFQTNPESVWMIAYGEPTVTNSGLMYLGQWYYISYSLEDMQCKTIVSMPADFYSTDEQIVQDNGIYIIGEHYKSQSITERTVEVYHIKDPNAGNLVPEKIAEIPTSVSQDAGAHFWVQPLNEHVNVETMFWNRNGIYLLDGEGEENRTILNWSDHKVNGLYIEKVYAVSSEQFIIVEEGNLKLLTVVDESVIDSQETLSFGVVGTLNKSISDYIVRYNSQADGAIVKVIEYTDEEALAQGLENGFALLNRDIIQHKAPDILWVPNGVGGQHYIQDGLFVDLYPFIDSDCELSRSSFIPSILAACEYKETLPTICATYSLLTAAGDPDVIGSESKWTWSEYETIGDKNKHTIAPYYPYARDTLLVYQMLMGGKKFLDYETGIAHLDSPEFVRLLKDSASYPEQMGDLSVDPKSYFTDKKFLLNIQFLGDFRSMLQQLYVFDGDIVYKGFPTEDDNSGSAIIPGLRLGITISCGKPNEAWNFVRSFLTNQTQETLGGEMSFPVNRDALNTLAKTAQKEAEEPVLPAYLYDVGLTENQLQYWKRGLTSAETEKITNLIQRTNVLYEYDDTIVDIIIEEAAYYYSGVRNAEDAAEIIQNRVQTYLAEQG